MARQIAYNAWVESNRTLPLFEGTITRFGELIENVTNRFVPVGNSYSFRDSLAWAFDRMYGSIISGDISGTRVSVTFDFHELGLPQPQNIEVNIDFNKLLQLLPAKLIACSKDYTAGIIAYDKYWDENGYRSVYFSVEPEACDETVSEHLLKNAVSWTMQWQYQDLTTLLGDCVRVPNELAEAWQNAINDLPGNAIFSDGIVLVEQGQTNVQFNATSPNNMYMLIAHPTCEKVSVLVADGPGQVQNIALIADGLTEATIQALQAGIITVAVSADPDSSLNPAYTMIVPEFPPFLILPLFMAATSLGVFVAKKKRS
jgi:hypothetical protein